METVDFLYHGQLFRLKLPETMLSTCSVFAESLNGDTLRLKLNIDLGKVVSTVEVMTFPVNATVWSLRRLPNNYKT